MSYSTLGTVNWGTDPVVSLAISYESQRSGTAMEYRIRISFSPVTDENYFGYPIYLGLTLDGTSVVSGYTVKGGNPSQWSSAITYDSGWVSVSPKTSGTAALRVRIYSGNGSNRDNTYTYSLPVSDYYEASDLNEDTPGSGGLFPLIGSLWPSASLSVSVVNDNSVIDGWGICVQGLSKLRYVITAQAHALAVIKSYQFSFAGQSLQGMTGITAPISASGMLTPSASVRDSRLLRTTVDGEPVQVFPYNAPRIRASSVCRCDSEGNETDEGTYLGVSCQAECSELDGRNGLTVRVRYRSIDGEYSGYIELQNGAMTTIGGNLDSHKTYEVELSAVDTVGMERAISYTVSTAAATFHLRDGGNGAAFGKYAESNELECAWDAKFLADVAVAGEVSAQTLCVGSKALVDCIHPVGSIYISIAATNPTALFGGGWQAIQGQFLVTGDNENSGVPNSNENGYSLTESETPSGLTVYMWKRIS